VAAGALQITPSPLSCANPLDLMIVDAPYSVGCESDYLCHCAVSICLTSMLHLILRQREVLGPRRRTSGPFFTLASGRIYSVFMEGRGIYREWNGWGTQHSFRVKYDEHQELDIAEDRYRARGYQPPFDQLPWKDESANDNA